MDKLSPTPRRPNEPDVADADWLFRDNPAPGAAGPKEAPIPSGPIEEFELADVPEPSGTAHPVPEAAPRPAPAPPPPRSRMVAPSAPAVDQVWSRTAEWGSTLLVLLGWGAAILVLLYFTMGAELYGVSALILAIGGLGAVLLSYPLVITLERPVRITPEQAAKDFFAALSHHLPHYRRMWLLLSSSGRVSPQFASYEGFKSYWIKRLGQLREGHSGRFSPLVFRVEEFRAEKSAGKTEIDARFKVKVLVRGRQAEGPIWSLPVERSFVRGPDGMWYLNDGTLAERTHAGAEEPRRARPEHLS